MRQVCICVHKIQIRQHNNRAEDAALHGIKVPMITESFEVSKKVDPERDKLMSAAMDAAVERLRARAKNGAGKSGPNDPHSRKL